MKKILLIPTVLFPYLILFCMYCIFSGFLMEELFQSFAPVMLIYVLIWLIVALLCNVIYIVISTVRKEDTVKLLKTNMIVKIAQIPAYIAIFVLGVLCFMTIFTIGFTIFFMLFDLVSVFLSGMLGFSAIIFSKEKRTPLFIVLGLLQFVMCVDVPLSIVIFVLSKNLNKPKPFVTQTV